MVHTLSENATPKMGFIGHRHSKLTNLRKDDGALAFYFRQGIEEGLTTIWVPTKSSSEYYMIHFFFFSSKENDTFLVPCHPIKDNNPQRILLSEKGIIVFCEDPELL